MNQMLPPSSIGIECMHSSENILHSVLQSAKDAIILADENGNIIFWNKSAEEIFGYAESEIIGQPLTVIMPERYRDAHRNGIMRLKSGKEGKLLGKTIELNGLKKNGIEFPLELSLSSWNTGNGILFSSIIRDLTERKKQEHHIQIFRKLVNLSNDLLLIISPDTGFITDANSTACELLGYSREQINKMKITDISSVRNTIEIWREHIAELRKKEKMLVQSHYAKANGETFPVEVSTRIVHINAEEYVIAVARDITERNEWEKALHESHAQYESLFENSPVALLMNDYSKVKILIDKLKKNVAGDLRDFFNSHTKVLKKCAELATIVDVNETHVKMFRGKAKSDLTGSLLRYINAPCTLKIFGEQIAQFYKGKTNFETFANRQFRSGKNQYLFIKVSIVPGFENTWAKVYVSIIDLTKQKESEKNLAESQAKFLGIFENAPIALLEEDFSKLKMYTDQLKSYGITDLQKYFEQMPESVKKCGRLAKITDVNQTALTLFGKKRKEDFTGSLLPLLTGKFSLQNFLTELVSFSKDPHLHYENYDIRKNPSGADLHTIYRVAIAPGYEETWRKVYVSITDITQQKDTETRLQEKNKELNTFIYKASHDLKSPLASISGLVNISKKQIKDAQAIAYLSMVGDATGKMDEILNNLLKISVLASGIPEMKPVFIKPIINDIINSIKYSPNTKNVVFLTSFNQKNSIMTDGNILHHVLHNLIDNAAKYKCPEVKKNIIKITISNKNKDWLKITVKDNGCGMSSETQSRMFDMFYRGHENSKGTGLGLYIVKSSVEKLGGNIQVKSELGKGSAFTVLLPKENSN